MAVIIYNAASGCVRTSQWKNLLIIITFNPGRSCPALGEGPNAHSTSCLRMHTWDNGVELACLAVWGMSWPGATGLSVLFTS